MNIYTYDQNTKEYTGKQPADVNPEETRLQEKFIPLVPANATLKELPEYNAENEIPVFENDSWIVKPDYRKNYKKADDNLLISDIKEIGELTDGYLVTNAIAQKIEENSDKYKIVKDQIEQKSIEEYNLEQLEKEAKRISMLHLTRGDVFRGLLQAKGLTRKQLRAIIEEMPDGMDKEMALIDFDEALEFYRGVPLIATMCSVLGISSVQMDKFFDTGDYTFLL